MIKSNDHDQIMDKAVSTDFYQDKNYLIIMVMMTRQGSIAMAAK